MFNKKYILKWWIFHCHVSFGGCNFSLYLAKNCDQFDYVRKSTRPNTHMENSNHLEDVPSWELICPKVPK